MLAALAGCAQPPGPVFGEWRSQTTAFNARSQKTVDLTLYGAPGARTGSYHITSTLNDPSVFEGHGTSQWSGTWTSSRLAAGEGGGTAIKLLDHLPDDVGGYALMSDGRLHILDPNGLPDITPAGAHYTLSPVTPPNNG